MGKPETPADPNPAWMVWTGRVISGLLSLLLLFSAVMKFIQPEAMIKDFAKFQYPEGILFPLGIIELASTILYINPRTAVLGAILLTGYLGGAIATHVRVSEDVVGQVIIGVLVWLALFLRDARLRSLIPWRSL